MYAGRVCCGIAAAGVLDCVLCGRSASMAAAEYGLAWDHSGGVQVLRYRCCGFVGLGNFARGATAWRCQATAGAVRLLTKLHSRVRILYHQLLPLITIPTRPKKHTDCLNLVVIRTSARKKKLNRTSSKKPPPKTCRNFIFTDGHASSSSCGCAFAVGCYHGSRWYDLFVPLRTKASSRVSCIVSFFFTFKATKNLNLHQSVSNWLTVLRKTTRRPNQRLLSTPQVQQPETRQPWMDIAIHQFCRRFPRVRVWSFFFMCLF